MEANPPMHRRGFCLWFTGLSGSGKSTTADVLTVMLQEHGRQITVLDGDIVVVELKGQCGHAAQDRRHPRVLVPDLPLHDAQRFIEVQELQLRRVSRNRQKFGVDSVANCTGISCNSQ